MRYGKLKNGQFTPAPSVLTADGFCRHCPTEEEYAMAGYLPVVETPYPVKEAGEAESDIQYLVGWEERGGQLVRVWTAEPAAAVAERRAAEEAAATEAEKQAILQWLSDNDWRVNKIMLGEWGADDPRRMAYLAERAVKRARLDELGVGG